VNSQFYGQYFAERMPECFKNNNALCHSLSITAVKTSYELVV